MLIEKSSMVAEQTHTLLVACQISLPDKSAGTVHVLAPVRVASIRLMRLHMRLKVVRALEQLAANIASTVGRVRRCEASLGLSIGCQHS